jgi:hypothetical protein
MANLIDLIINAQNKASPAIKQVSGDLKNLEKSSTEANTSLSSLGAKAAGAFGLTLGVAGVLQLTRAISDLAIQAGKAQQLRASFDDLASGVGQSSTKMLDAMKAASDGLVSEADLILSANKAMLLGVADTGAELSALLEVARSRGAAMGLSTTQAFNDIVTGLGRESALILDNLGITIDLEGVMQKYAASLGTTASALDATQRKQALLNEVMAQSAGLVAPIETAATAWERASVAIADAKMALGELFGPVVAEVLKGVADAANATTDLIRVDAMEVARVKMEAESARILELAKTIEAASIAAAAMEFYDPASARSANTELARLQATIIGMVDGYNMNAVATGQVMLSVEQATQGVIAYDYAATEAANATAQLTATEQALTSILPATAAGVANLQAKLIGLAASADTTSAAIRSAFMGATTLLGVEGAIVGLRQTNTELAALRGEWIANDKTATEMQFLEADYVARTNQKLSDQRQALSDANRAAEKLASQGISAAAKAYSDLTSKISGVVSGLTSISDIAIESGGPRTDAANENARRLAAIANEGLVGQTWLAEFQAEAPKMFDAIVASADPRGAAAKLYEEFQAGMHPELLDREMIKDNIRRMILGEETMSAYVEEIAAEIRAENNLSPAAEAIVTGVTSALTNQQMGQQVGATTLASVNTPAAITEFQNAGESAFGSWKTGWDTASSTWHPYPPSTGGIPLESVPPAGGALPPVNIVPFGGTTQQSNTSSNTSVSVTVNAGSNTNPTAIGMAARSGVLDGLRAAGVR